MDAEIAVRTPPLPPSGPLPTGSQDDSDEWPEIVYEDILDAEFIDA